MFRVIPPILLWPHEAVCLLSVLCDHPILNPGGLLLAPQHSSLQTLSCYFTLFLSQLRFCSDILDLDTACSILLVFEIAEIEKVSPLQSLKFAIFLVILVIFTSDWENSKPPLQNKCRLRSYLKRLCSCPWSHIAERGRWRPISIFRQVSLSALTAKWSLMSVLWRILLGGSKRY